MSADDILIASERGDLDEVNRMILEGVKIDHQDEVCDTYYTVMSIILIIIAISYNRMDGRHYYVQVIGDTYKYANSF
jgi:hypothetical protein